MADKLFTVPMDFGVQADGSLRLTIHIADVSLLHQILHDLGENAGQIMEALSEQMQQFIDEHKENDNG